MQTNDKKILLTITAIVIIVLAFIVVYYFTNSQTEEPGQPVVKTQPGKPVVVYAPEVKSFAALMPEIAPGSGETKVEMKQEQPEVRLKKWNGEVDLGVSYKKIDATAELEPGTEIVKWAEPEGKEELHAYTLEPTAQMEGGGVEIEVILNEPPETNAFDFQIDGYEELDFFYQPPELPAEVIAELGNVNVPENAKGSYAVYHKTKKHHVLGQTNYATGKAYHIYRPKVIDANNNEIWAELSYQDGTLTVTVPQDFLDSAVYPVRVDPTFGYTTIGTYSTSFNQTYVVGDKATGVAGTLQSVSVYCETGGDDRGMIGGVYIGKDTLLTDSGGEQTEDCTSTPAWRTSDITSGARVTSTAATYWAVALVDGNVSASVNVGVYFDIGSYDSDQNISCSNAYFFPAWPSTCSTGDTFRFSVYSTYVPDGPYYVGNGGLVSGSDTTLNVPYPSGIQADDVLLLQVDVHDNTPGISTPAGWTEIYQDSVTNHGYAYYIKRATGSESGSLAVTTGTVYGNYGIMSLWTNVQASGDMYDDAIETTHETDTSAASQAITTLGSDRLVVVLSNSGFSTSRLGSWSGSYDTNFWATTTADWDAGLEAASQLKQSAGTVAAETATYGSGSGTPWHTHVTLALIPRNATPTITDIIDTPDPVSQGNSVSFDIDWDDENSEDQVKVKLCKTNGISNQNCTGGFWASSSVFTNDDPETLFYQTTEDDYPQIEWYGYVCDDYGACSSATSGTTTISLPAPAGTGIKLRSGTWKINLEDVHLLFLGFLIPAFIGIKQKNQGNKETRKQ